MRNYKRIAIERQRVEAEIAETKERNRRAANAERQRRFYARRKAAEARCRKLENVEIEIEA